MSFDGAAGNVNSPRVGVSFRNAYIFVGVVNLVLWILAGVLMDSTLVVFGVFFTALVMAGTIRAQRLRDLRITRKSESVRAEEFRKAKTTPMMKAATGPDYKKK